MENKFQIRAYTGATIKTFFYGSLIIDVSGIRASQKMPVLREHHRDRVVGWSKKTHNDGRSFYVEGQFSKTTQDGQEVEALLQEGFPWQSSIGVWVEMIEKVAQGETVTVNDRDFKGPGTIWRKSWVREVSVVALGADSRTRVKKATAAASGSADFLKTDDVVKSRNEDLKFPGERIDQVIGRLSSELAAKEGIPIEEATNRVLMLNPGLRERFEADLLNPVGHDQAAASTSGPVKVTPLGGSTAPTHVAGGASGAGTIEADAEVRFHEATLRHVREEGKGWGEAMRLAATQEPEGYNEYLRTYTGESHPKFQHTEACKDFNQAIEQVLSEGVPISRATEEARRRMPDLYEAYVQTLFVV